MAQGTSEQAPAQVVEVKRTVNLENGQSFYLVAFNFSLENKVFKEMVATIREVAGDERKFFWDAELKVWAVDCFIFDEVREIAMRFYRQSTDTQVDELRRQIRKAAIGD